MGSCRDSHANLHSAGGAVVEDFVDVKDPQELNSVLGLERLDMLSEAIGALGLDWISKNVVRMVKWTQQMRTHMQGP